MFEIDFFELCFLAEACEPPQPIARTTFWYKLINSYFHSMANYEKARFYKYMEDRVKGSNNRDVLMLLARFNPDNQYKYAGSSLFLFEGEYWYNTDTKLQDEYKSQVKKV